MCNPGAGGGETTDAGALERDPMGVPHPLAQRPRVFGILRRRHSEMLAAVSHVATLNAASRSRLDLLVERSRVRGRAGAAPWLTRLRWIAAPVRTRLQGLALHQEEPASSTDPSPIWTP